jgi:UDP-glucose 4-epimerase
MPGALAGRRAAVVGATGFIGSHLTESLVHNGAEVLAIAHTRRRLANLDAVAGRCRFELADILSSEATHTVLGGFAPHIVFHLAAEADSAEHLGHLKASLETNAVGTANVADAAAAAGAEVLIYADSCKVYGNGPVPHRESQPEAPVCSYAIGKVAGWQLCRLVGAKTGLPVCSLRSTFVYGPRQNPNLITHVEACARRGEPVHLMGGTQTRDLLYIDDAVRAFLAAAATPAAWGRALPIGGGCERSVLDICRDVLDVLGSGVEAAAGAEPARLTEIWRSFCDNREAGDVLHWAPRILLREGLRRTLAAAVSEVTPVQ